MPTRLIHRLQVTHLPSAYWQKTLPDVSLMSHFLNGTVCLLARTLVSLVGTCWYNKQLCVARWFMFPIVPPLPHTGLTRWSSKAASRVPNSLNHFSHFFFFDWQDFLELYRIPQSPTVDSGKAFLSRELLWNRSAVFYFLWKLDLDVILFLSHFQCLDGISGSGLHERKTPTTLTI